MPSTHFYFLAHIYFWWFLLNGWIWIVLWNDFFAFVCSISSRVLSSLIHEFNVNTAICLILNIYDMNICIISSSYDHARVRRNLQIKLIEDILWFINLTQFFLEVFSHIQKFNRLSLISNVPYLKSQVVSSINVIFIGWWKFCPRNRVNDICKKMLSRRVLLYHKFGWASIELRRNSQVT